VKQKKQLVILIVLLAVAGNVWYWFFLRDRTPAPADIVAVAQTFKPLPVGNPQPHTDPLDRARKAEYKSAGRNIFSRETPPPPPPKIPKPKPIDPNISKDPPPPVIPTVSPLPAKFFGYGTIPNGTVRVAFFTDGENVYIVAEGEVLMKRFRILKIGNANLEYEELSSGLRGTANLEEQAAPPSA